MDRGNNHDTLNRGIILLSALCTDYFCNLKCCLKNRVDWLGWFFCNVTHSEHDQSHIPTYPRKFLPLSRSTPKNLSCLSKSIYLMLQAYQDQLQRVSSYVILEPETTLFSHLRIKAIFPSHINTTWKFRTSFKLSGQWESLRPWMCTFCAHKRTISVRKRIQRLVDAHWGTVVREEGCSLLHLLPMFIYLIIILRYKL